MADITRDLVGRLDTKDKEIVVIDTEAGVESFGRGVERSVDTVLVIVEPSFQSIALAERIYYMAGGMGIRRVRTILNKVGSVQSEQKMIVELKKKNIAVLGTIGFDNEINEAGFEGRALGGESRTKNDIKQMVRILLEES
jgi:CO dehydrogenase maturation factor